MSIPEEVSTSFEVYLKRQKFSNYAFEPIKKNLFLEKIYLDTVFNFVFKVIVYCSNRWNSLYYDSNHLTNKGAEVLIKNTNLVE